MEIKNEIYNAARDGKLRKIKVCLDHRPKEEVKLIVSTPTNGSTPLIIAARNGYLNVCEYIIEKCNADIEQVGNVCFDNETIENAPPLWCASAAGHFDIVNYLINHGAQVNNTTKTNSTPLRAACFDGHLDIARLLVKNGADIEIANRHGHTCLMIACYKGHLEIVKFLINNGADINRKSIKGNTALHDCAESGNIAIMKLLLSHGAKMDVDAYGMTPLYCAALSGHTNVVQLITSLSSCSLIEKINAYELLGATFVDKKRDMLSALDFWRKALSQRNSNSKKPIEKEISCPVEAYDNSVEVTTLQELEELIFEPDKMRMQALLVRERILGSQHPDTSYYIRYRGAVYADTGNFDRCIKLWKYALDIQPKAGLNGTTQSVLLSFIELFSYMMSKSLVIVRFDDLFDIFKRSLLELNLVVNANINQDSENYNSLLFIILNFIGLLCNLRPILTAIQEDKFKQQVYNLIKLNPKGKNGSSLVHLVCSGKTSLLKSSIYTISMLNVLELLLAAGASPNLLDIDLNSPLHIAATLKDYEIEFFDLLLKNGAHLDVRNALGKMPLEISNNSSLKLHVNQLQFCNLQCLCARKIVQNGIEYKHLLHKKLENFVDLH